MRVRVEYILFSLTDDEKHRVERIQRLKKSCVCVWQLVANKYTINNVNVNIVWLCFVNMIYKIHE